MNVLPVFLAGTLAASPLGATQFQGNGATGFGGAIGEGVLTLDDDGITVTGTLSRGPGDFDDTLVLFIDSVPGGFANTSGFGDGASGLLRSISGFDGGANRSTLTFPAGFEADYAIAIGPANESSGGLWSLANGVDDSMNLIADVALDPTGDANADNYGFTFSVGALGLVPGSGASFRVIGSYVRNDGFRSGEAVPGDVTGTTGWSPFTATESGFHATRGPVVSNTDDSGPGSLRDAVALAAPNATITFAPALSGETITLLSQLLLDKDVTIDASSLVDGIELSGDDATRIFRVDASASVSLSSLTVSSGLALFGGGILNDGELVLNRCTIRDNHADDYGGGIFNDGNATLTVDRCTFSGNSAAGAVFGGGGISNDGELAVDQSTFTGNSAVSAGGGIDNSGGVLTLRQSTVTTNTAASGGGVAAQGTVEISNSIVAANTGGQISGPFSGGDNHTAGDPRLAPLAGYGGRTFTRPPLPGSPVIDAALASAFTTDQRGAPRVNGPLPDIGAVEAVPFSTLVPVDSDDDGIDDRLEPSYPQLTVGVDDSALDSDGDGSSDADELGSMTDPQDGADYLRILTFSPAVGFDPITNPRFDLSFTTFPGLSYELERSPGLSGFAFVPGSQVAAAGYSHAMQVLLGPGRDFVRVRRGLVSVRWATSVLGFSSQYDTIQWSAAQTLGPPNTYPAYGDIVSAWASATPDGQAEFLELGFNDPAPVNVVSIYETLAPGAVNKVSVRNANTGVWTEVWTGPAAAAPPVARIFTVTFPLTAYPVDAVRIDLDSPAVADWNEIDAVSIGTAGP
jgi:hypothetical protein